MKVTFKTGSEANYGSTNGELFFASNTKQIMLNGIKYIPKKLSELTNDSGFISSITKSMVEGVLTGNITSHTHSQYLTSLPSRLSQYITAELDDGNGFGKLSSGSPFKTFVNSSYNDCMLITTAYSATWRGELALDYYSNNIAYRNNKNGTWNSWAMMLTTDNFNKYALPLSGGTLTGTLNMPSQQINAGSITASAYINADSISANSISCNNKDVSLDGHTHTFASLTSKPTTLSGYGITDIKHVVGYNFSNGCLVKTKVSGTGTFVRLHIYGNTNSTSLNKAFKPICTIVDCYKYITDVIELNATHFGEDFGDISAFIYNGYLCFWFKQPKNSTVFNVYGYITTYESDNYNIVSEITNQPIPSENVSNLTTVTPTKIAYTFGTSSQFLKGDGSLDSNTYALSSALNNYLPLSGGTMSNTSLVTNLNADLLDGLNSSDFVRNQNITSTSSTSIDANNVWVNAVKHDYRWENVPNNGIASLLDLSYSSDWRTQLFFQPASTLKFYARQRYNGNTWGAWREIAFTDSNVASASKWSNARTITLTGSVTGSVSIDGSANVSLDTALNLENKHLNAGSITVSANINAESISATNQITCNNKDVSLDGHTHAFASLEDKPTTLSGYGITNAYTKTETNTELGKYLPLTGGTLTGALTVPTLTATGKILLGDSSLSAMVGSIGIQRHDETGFIGFLKELNLDNSFNGVVIGWDGNYSLQGNSVRIDASTFTYKGNSVLHSGNLGYTSSGLSRAVQKDANGNLFIVAPSLFEQGISNNYPKNLRWTTETEGQLVYDTEETAGSTTMVEVGIPLAHGTSKGFLKSTSTVTNVTGYTPCPVVSGTPYYKEDCLYLGSTEIGYTGIMEYGIQYTYNYGTKLPYLEDYTPDSIPRCVVLCFPDRSSNYRFLFWLSAFDEGDPYIARFYNSAYETWLTIDTASRQIILSYGDTWQS